MATIQTLQAKVQKAQETVEKRKATIARHEKQLVKKVATLEKAYGNKVDISNLDAIKWVDGKGADWYWEACDVERKLDDIKGAKKKLAEAERILAGHEERLSLAEEKERVINNEIPQVIIDFLEEWKAKTFEWYVRRYKAYQQFKKDIEKEEKQAYKELGIDSMRMPTRAQREALKERKLDWESVKKRKANFAGAIILNMDTMSEVKRLKWLEATLETDKKAKILDLINRINHVVGAITDATNLRISSAGNINGFVIGTKGKAEVETITAGGWNIVCFHYRTLVKPIK